ncbi:hypothetical protein AB0G04_19185 [Actinoplanes sp. NPDC023801]|uniref:hypothetical protein n=1 Tax=Actinoplanes sp. NPDC023801 TaxID=3154595 RepID=UPI0033E78832
MAGWDPTLYADGPGHHTFILERGDIATSPPAGNRFPTMYHAVAKGTPYSWANRYWYTGTAVWWGSVTYRRANVPGATTTPASASNSSSDTSASTGQRVTPPLAC